MTSAFSEAELVVLAALTEGGIRHMVVGERAIRAQLEARHLPLSDAINDTPAKVHVNGSTADIEPLLERDDLALVKEPKKLPRLVTAGPPVEWSNSAVKSPISTAEFDHSGVYLAEGLNVLTRHGPEEWEFPEPDIMQLDGGAVAVAPLPLLVAMQTAEIDRLKGGYIALTPHQFDRETVDGVYRRAEYVEKLRRITEEIQRKEPGSPDSAKNPWLAVHEKRNRPGRWRVS